MRDMTDLELIGMFPGLPVTMRLVSSLADHVPFDQVAAAAVEYVAMADVAAWATSKQPFDRRPR